MNSEITYQYFYYQPKYFEALFELMLEFDFTLNPKKRQREGFDFDKYKKEEKGYLEENASSPYYRFYLCAFNNELVGFTWFGQSDNDRQEGFVGNLFVKPNHRKKGIASKLLTAAFEWIKAKNCNSVELDVDVDNKAAIELYEKIGFIKQKPTSFTYKKRLP